MNARHRVMPQDKRLLNRDANPVRVAEHSPLNARNTNLLLLISDDATLCQSLRHAAEQAKLLLAHSAAVGAALWQVRALRPGAVLLDMDLPSETAWETADRILEFENCPPLVLITARIHQFDVRAARRAGPIVDKSAGINCLLRLAVTASAQSASSQVERNSIQRIFIRWLRPCCWSVRLTPAQRFRGRE
jgi:CheY-like chemotaxis protein